jgi:hypothetical protein
MKTTVLIYVKRWFDKFNGNSYFNYYIILKDTEGNRTQINAKYNLEYWYGNYPFQRATEHLTELGYNLDDLDIEEIDLWYWLQRDMKNMTK